MFTNELWKVMTSLPYMISNLGRMRNLQGKCLCPKIPGKGLAKRNYQYTIYVRKKRQSHTVPWYMSMYWPFAKVEFTKRWYDKVVEQNKKDRQRLERSLDLADEEKKVVLAENHTWGKTPPVDIEKPRAYVVDVESWEKMTMTPGCKTALCPEYMPLDYKEMVNYGCPLVKRSCLLSSDSRSWFFDVFDMVSPEMH